MTPSKSLPAITKTARNVRPNTSSSGNKRQQPPKMHIQFQKLHVVNTFSSDTGSPSVMISTQYHTYVFNCGEGMQRLLQTKGRIPKYSDIFLTRLTWDVAGGLPGYLLTTSALVESRTQIHGPKNTAHFLATFRNYIFRTSMDLSVNEFTSTPEPYVDETVTITPIPLSLSPKSSHSRSPSTSSSAFLKPFSYPTPTFEGTEEEVLAYKKNIVHEMFKRGVTEEDIIDNETSADTQFKQNRRARRNAIVGVSLPATEPTDITMAYLLKNKDLPGKMDMQKVKALKIPVGPVLAKLKAGEDIEIPVEGEDGGKAMRIIKPEDVLGESIHGPVVLVLDIPKVEYVKQVVQNERLNSEMVKTADVVVHMLSNDVADSKEYIKWMESFGESTKHLVMASKLTPDNLAIPDAYMQDLDRNALDESIFPLAHHAGELIWTPNSYSKKYTPSPPLPSPYKDSRFIIDIRVGSQIDFLKGLTYKAARDGPGIVEAKHYLGQSGTNRLELEKVVQGTKELISQAAERRVDDRYPGRDVEIITLGTGSAIPNKYRNVSCNVVRIPGVGNIIFDCGEGTSASLKRHFSPIQYKEFIKGLRTVYVSHLHADHHLGILGVLKEYNKLQQSLPADQRQPLFLIAPWRLFSSLYEYNQIENIGLDEYVIPFSSYNLIPQHLIPPSNVPQPVDIGLFQGFLSTMDLRAFETCFVPHCPHAYGVAITHKSGWKIVYSGDCRPSGDLVEIGRDATVLIHEATVAETQPQDALEKMHCTTGEAIMVGKHMNARHILLTHFSQKWSRVPEFVIDWNKHKDEAEGKYENVGIAFDHMSVKVAEMWKLPLMYSAFEVMYGDEKGRNSWIKMQNTKEGKKGKRELEEKVDPPSKKVHVQPVEHESLATGDAVQ